MSALGDDGAMGREARAALPEEGAARVLRASGSRGSTRGAPAGVLRGSGGLRSVDAL